MQRVTGMDDNVVTLGHGSGGILSHDLVTRVFLPCFDSTFLLPLEDAVVLPALSAPIVFTTDSYVVNPLFFPGGDIGRLSVCGTVNDLCMRGAVPLYISTGFILEEGLPIRDLEKVLRSMSQAAKEAGVSVVCGDTKVVQRGAADGLFINTAGIGVARNGVTISVENARPGDVIVVNGTLGDHGIAVLSQRLGARLTSSIRSDTVPLNGLVHAVLEAYPTVHVMRDPTRGGIGTTLKEIAVASNVGIDIEEDLMPISQPVAAACSLLGLDQMYLANEGKVVILAAEKDAQGIVGIMKDQEHGKEAAVIGRVTADHPGIVTMRNAFGARRVVEMLTGEQFPRIC